MARVTAPTRQRFKQYVCGARLLRGQSVKVSYSQIETELASTNEKIKNGAIILIDEKGMSVSSNYKNVFVVREGMKVIECDDWREFVSSGREQKPEEQKVEEEDDVKEDDVEEDDLTVLAGIGSGREKKLKANGIKTFVKLASMEPAILARLVGAPMTTDGAKEIISAAARRVEG